MELPGSQRRTPVGAGLACPERSRRERSGFFRLAVLRQFPGAARAAGTGHQPLSLCRIVTSERRPGAGSRTARQGWYPFPRHGNGLVAGSGGGVGEKPDCKLTSTSSIHSGSEPSARISSNLVRDFSGNHPPAGGGFFRAWKSTLGIFMRFALGVGWGRPGQETLSEWRRTLHGQPAFAARP